MSVNSRIISINSNRIESICLKLENRLRDAQLEGLLERELQICLLIGKRYWTLGYLEKAVMFFKSSLEISFSVNDSKSSMVAYEMLLSMSMEYEMCPAILVDYFESRISSGNMTLELANFILCSLLFSNSDLSLLFVKYVCQIKGFLGATNSNCCHWFVCTIMLNLLYFGSVNKSDRDRLEKFSSSFGCSTCDLLTHIRILHLLGDICLSQDLESLAGSFFELALSLSTTKEYTEYLYFTCLLKLSKLYALEGQIELAWTTIYVAKDLSSISSSPVFCERLNSLAYRLDLLSKRENQSYSLLSLGAIKRAFDGFDNNFLALPNHIALYRNHPKIFEIMQASASKSKNGVNVLAMFSWLNTLNVSVNESSAWNEMIQLNSMRTVASGIRSYILGEITEYEKYCNELYSEIKAECLSSNHDHSFSYFQHRSASKSLLKLVDGYKMDTKSNKSTHGLVLETNPRKIIEQSTAFDDNRPSKKHRTYMFRLKIADRIFEHSINSDMTDVATLGWLKSQISGEILRGDFLYGEIGSCKDLQGNIYRNNDMLITIIKNNTSEQSLLLEGTFIPTNVDIESLSSSLNLSFFEMEWLRHSLLVNSSAIHLCFIDRELVRKINSHILNILKWLPKDSCMTLRSISLSREIDTSLYTSINIQGNRIDDVKLDCCTSLCISQTINSFDTLSNLTSKLSSNIVQLDASDCNLVLDEIFNPLFSLDSLNLSFGLCSSTNFLISIGMNCPNITNLVLDGIEIKLFDDKLPSTKPLSNLKHLSLGFFATGIFPCFVLEALLSPNFCGTVDLRHSNIIGYEDRLTRALMTTSFSALDLTGVVSEKEIVVKSSFM